MSQILIPPRTFKENIQYRAEVRNWALKSEANREYLMKRCKEDFVFWLETFCWLYEPRPDEDKPNVIPFIPWVHQRPVIEAILDPKVFGHQDIGLEKARGEGASWICLMIILWRWIFYRMESFGLVSMNELAADNPEDPNSLGWKLDWQISQLPKWMVGEPRRDYTRNHSKHTWVNRRTKSTMTAYACTGDLASGGRKTAFFMDELAKFPRGPDEESMAATEPVTNCRILVSTPKGSEGAYYQAMHEDATLKKIVLDWTRNPTRNQNMFRIDANHRKLLSVSQGIDSEIRGPWVDEFWDVHYPMLSRRGYDVTSKSKVWSPWYVSRCLRSRMTPKKVAQEYDRDYGGSSSRFFPHSVIEALCEHAKDPTVIGEVIWDQDTLTIHSFTPMSTGNLRLWLELSGNGRPPAGEYVLGVDVATGQGGSMSSNSVITILDRTTGRKVGSYANPMIIPERLAELAITLARWFRTPGGGEAYMIWEANGPGGSFRRRIMESSFRNFYYRTSLKSVRGKATKDPGWHSGKEQKRELLGKYRHSLIEGLYENNDYDALRETLCYVEGTGGKIEFVSTLYEEDDPANAGENHGDRVIADALTNFAMEEMGGASGLKKNEDANKVSVMNLITAPEGSFGSRRKQWLDGQRKEVGWSKRG